MRNVGYYEGREYDSLTGVPMPSVYPDDMRVVTPPPSGALVVDVPTAKSGLVMPDMTNDDLLLIDIQGVTDQIERYLGRDLLTRTRQAVYFRPASTIYLMPVPVAEITLVQGLSDNGDTSTLTEGDGYKARGYRDNVQVYDIRNPYTMLEVTYTTGYGGPSDVPAAIRKAILQETYRQFKRRQDPDISSNHNVDSLSAEAQALIRSYKVRRAL